MNLNTLTIYIKKYGIIFVIVIFLVILIFILSNKPKFFFNFNTNLTYQKVGPEGGSYTPTGYNANTFPNATFYIKVTNAQIRYFKVLSGNTTGYFIGSDNLIQYENNPLYLGDSLGYNIFNISIPPLNQPTLSRTLLISHFTSIPSYLLSKKIYIYLTQNLQDFYPTSPVLKSVSVKGYKEGVQYNVIYSYFAVPLLAQAEPQPFVKKIDIIINKVSGSWKPVSVKIL